MVVLIACKNEEDPIKNEGARVLTTFSPLYFYGDFSRLSRAANSAVLVQSGRISSLSEILWLNEEDPIKNEGARVLTTFSPL